MAYAQNMNIPPNATQSQAAHSKLSPRSVTNRSRISNGQQILPGVDKDVVNVVRRSFKGRGIYVKVGTKVLGHTPGSTGTTISLEGEDALNVDAVVVSVGRRPLSETLGLYGTGVAVDGRGFVERMRYES